MTNDKVYIHIVDIHLYTNNMQVVMTFLIHLPERCICNVIQNTCKVEMRGAANCSDQYMAYTEDLNVISIICMLDVFPHLYARYL